MMQPEPGDRRHWDEFRRRPRIFNIGLNKTSTTSFHAAMEVLGFRSLHWGGPTAEQAVERAYASGEPLLTYLDARFDAFSDLGPLTFRYERLDREYPGSRFVMTVRPLEAWIASRRRHVEENVRRQASGDYDGTFLVVEEERWRAQWTSHLEGTRAYFAGRADFLEIDISADPGWEPLCTLLDLPVPEAPFPWANRTDASLVIRAKKLVRRALKQTGRYIAGANKGTNPTKPPISNAAMDS
jgi:hypothetical protein